LSGVIFVWRLPDEVWGHCCMVVRRALVSGRIACWIGGGNGVPSRNLNASSVAADGPKKDASGSMPSGVLAAWWYCSVFAKQIA